MRHGAAGTLGGDGEVNGVRADEKRNPAREFFYRPRRYTSGPSGRQREVLQDTRQGSMPRRPVRTIGALLWSVQRGGDPCSPATRDGEVLFLQVGGSVQCRQWCKSQWLPKLKSCGPILAFAPHRNWCSAMAVQVMLTAHLVAAVHFCSASSTLSGSGTGEGVVIGLTGSGHYLLLRGDGPWHQRRLTGQGSGGQGSRVPGASRSQRPRSGL